MQEKIARIIEILEEADGVFKSIRCEAPEARALWESGIEKLAAAIWICERKEEEPK